MIISNIPFSPKSIKRSNTLKLIGNETKFANNPIIGELNWASKITPHESK